MFQEPRVPFLENLSKFSQSDAPDSLLVLKLSDLVRDPKLLQIFDVYLRDVHGPTHWLDCFLQANDVLHRLQAVKVRYRLYLKSHVFRMTQATSSMKSFRMHGNSIRLLFIPVPKLKLNSFLLDWRNLLGMQLMNVLFLY
jgi:hypothetical protein